MRILSILGCGSWRIRLLYPGRGPKNPSRPASSSCCFFARYRHNQPRFVRKKGCYALQHLPLSPLCLLLRPVLPGCSLLFTQKDPDETLVWRKCRPEQLQTGTHLSSGSPECQTILCPQTAAVRHMLHVCQRMLRKLFALSLPCPVRPSLSLPTIPVRRDGNATSLRSSQSGMVGVSASSKKVCAPKGGLNPCDLISTDRAALSCEFPRN